MATPIARDVKDGSRYPYTATADILPGGVVAFGITPNGFVGVSESGIKDTKSDDLNIKDSHAFPKVDGTAALDGAPAYWDVSEDEMTPTATDNIRAGVFVGAFASGDTECRVNIGVR